MNITIPGSNPPHTFLVCRDTETGVEERYLTSRLCADHETMAHWVRMNFRRLELVEARPYDPVEDRHRPLLPVPVQHVLFDPPRRVELPKPQRFGVLISQRFGQKLR